MFETNIQNNSSLISLSRAAEITGYHQDYLGQLCRLGRLPAKKVGRNWFTSAEALDSLKASSQIVDQSEESIEPAMREVSDVIRQLKDSAEVRVSMTDHFQPQAQPELAQTITISQVEGLPIAIQTLQTEVRPVNNVQTIATNLRVQALQREVSELREMLLSLMAEVAEHTELLQGRNFSEIWQRQALLNQKYVSNFDFSSPNQSVARNTEANETDQVGIVDYGDLEQAPRFAIVTWVSAAAAMALVAFLVVGAITGSLWGSQAAVKTVYYHSNNKIATDPRVAGESTVISGQPTSNVVQ